MRRVNGMINTFRFQLEFYQAKVAAQVNQPNQSAALINQVPNKIRALKSLENKINSN